MNLNILLVLILKYWEMIWIVFSENNQYLVSQTMGSIPLAHGLEQHQFSFGHVNHKLYIWVLPLHYNDVVMGMMESQITSLTIVYSNVYSGADQRKHQISTSLAFVWGIHRGPVNSPHKWPVKRKMFPFDDLIMDPLWCFGVIRTLTRMITRVPCHYVSYSLNRNFNKQEDQEGVIFSSIEIIINLNTLFSSNKV